MALLMYFILTVFVTIASLLAGTYKIISPNQFIYFSIFVLIPLYLWIFIRLIKLVASHLRESLLALGKNTDVAEPIVSKFDRHRQSQTSTKHEDSDTRNFPPPPEDVEETFTNFNSDVWDRGYILRTHDGTWYELYVNTTTKSYYPTVQEISEALVDFTEGNTIDLSCYDDFGQITFFEKPNEQELTLEELTEILA